MSEALVGLQAFSFIWRGKMTQITLEDKTSVKKNLHVEIPAKIVAKELDKAYNQLKKTAKVKGFRPGKTPRSILERMLKKDVHGDVVSKLIQDSFIEALKEKDLAIVGEPTIKPTELDPAAPYTYEAALEVRPELGTIDFSGIALKKTLYRASDQEVDNQIEMLRKNMAKLEPITDDRPAETGDSAMLNYEGLKDGKPYDATQKTEGFTMKIGARAISEEFDDQVIGMKQGEAKEFDITFQDDHFNKDLAGQTIHFNVALSEIRQEVLPDVDDEFVKKIGPFDTVEALRNKIIENLTEGYDKRTEQELGEQVFEALIARTDFEVPDVMIQYELDGIMAETENALATNNLTLEQIGRTREDMENEYKGTADKQVRRHLILGALIEQEKLELPDEELESGFQDMAKSFNQPVEGIKGFYQQNQDKLDFFKHTLLEKKAMRLIIDGSDVEEVEPETSEDNAQPE